MYGIQWAYSPNVHKLLQIYEWYQYCTTITAAHDFTTI